MCKEQEIQSYHLPPELKQPQTTLIPSIREDMFASRTLEEHERKYILSVLSRVNSNKTKVAEILAIDRVSLWQSLKRMRSREWRSSSEDRMSSFSPPFKPTASSTLLQHLKSGKPLTAGGLALPEAPSPKKTALFPQKRE